MAILFIDLDGFKNVNDNIGHQAGDDLLVAVGSRITKMLRPADTLARLSGDEFIIVCEDLEEEGQIEGIAARLVEAIASPFNLNGFAVEVSASIGIAFAGQGNDPEHLLHKADVAMYQAKRKGGAHHQVIDISEQDLNEFTESLRMDLPYAVQRNELRLEYQPIVRTSDGRILCVEALLRWDHPSRGLIAPAILIPMAEQSGDIVGIGKWVLEHACIDRHRWEGKTGDRALTMAVNVSARQLIAPGFVAMVTDVLSSADTMAAQLCLEITESVFIRDARLATTVLSQLKELGIQMALDDFGMGYSSLSYLRQFPVDVIKIDQSFIADLTAHAASHAIVLKTIELAHLLDLTVVCEGVETAEQDRHVTALTSDFSQGYFYAPPMTAEMLDDIMSPVDTVWMAAAGVSSDRAAAG